MTVARTIALFKNDILRTIEDARAKGMDDAEVDHRLGFVWGVTLADLGM
jgi:hypothetical protein